MKIDNQHIKSLVALLSDSDIAKEVELQIIKIGQPALAELEAAINQIDDDEVIHQYEQLIDKIQFDSLAYTFKEWHQTNYADNDVEYLLKGLLIVAGLCFDYQIPSTAYYLARLNEIVQEVDLQADFNFNTREKAALISEVMFDKYEFKTTSGNYVQPQSFCLNHILSNLRGHEFLLGVVFLLIARALHYNFYGVPVNSKLLIAAYNKCAPSSLQQAVDIYFNPIKHAEAIPRGLLRKYLVETQKEDPAELAIISLQPVSDKMIIASVLQEMQQAYTQLQNPLKAQQVEHLLHIMAY